jgi:hypothetical protein
MSSGSSGESLARRSERSTARRRLSSSITLVVVEALLRPIVERIVTEVSVVSPDVVT